MQQEMFEEVINEMLTGKFCGMCLSKMHYADKAVEGYCNTQRCSDYEQVFRKVSDIYYVGKERICFLY